MSFDTRFESAAMLLAHQIGAFSDPAIVESRTIPRNHEIKGFRRFLSGMNIILMLNFNGRLMVRAVFRYRTERIRRPGKISTSHRAKNTAFGAVFF